MNEEELLRLLLAQQPAPAAPFAHSLAPSLQGEMPTEGPFGPMTDMSVAGFSSPEDYDAAQGSIQNRPQPYDPLRPAYQGAADVMSTVAAPVVSGSRLASDPSIKHATEFGIDASLAMAPWAMPATTAKRIAGISAGGLGAAVATDISDAEARTRKKKRRRSEAPPPEPVPEPQSVSPPPMQTEEGSLGADDPRIRAIDQQINQLTPMLTDMDVPRSARPEIGRQIETLRTERMKVLGELTQGSQTFAQRFPTTNGLWPAIQIGAGAMGGIMTKRAMEGTRRLQKAPWKAAVDKGEAALEKGDIGAATRAARTAEKYNKNPTGQPGLADKAAPVIGGATVGAETANFRQQYDYANTRPGTKEHEQAKKDNAPEEVVKRGVIGGVLGGLGGFTGSHAMKSKTTSDPLQRSEALVENVRGGNTQAYRDLGDDLSEAAVQTARVGAVKTGSNPGHKLPNGAQGDLNAANQARARTRAARQRFHDTPDHGGMTQAIKNVANSGRHPTVDMVMRELKRLYPNGRVDDVKINRAEVRAWMMKHGYFKE